MNSAQEQITPKTAALIASLAAASGVTVDEYLHQMLEESAQARGMDFDAYINSILAASNGPPHAAPLDLAELDRLFDELSEGTDHLTPLPPNFSRADIYGDN